MTKRESVWDIIFRALIWIGLIIIFCWLLLKAFGLMQSLDWVEIIPYLGGALTILGAAYQLGKIKQGIDETNRKVNRLLIIEQRFGTLYHEHEIAMGRIKIKKH